MNHVTFLDIFKLLHLASTKKQGQAYGWKINAVRGR